MELVWKKYVTYRFVVEGLVVLQEECEDDERGFHSYFRIEFNAKLKLAFHVRKKVYTKINKKIMKNIIKKKKNIRVKKLNKK